jgi:predicted  nucleic acid-binding Zn-ribbon protein
MGMDETLGAPPVPKTAAEYRAAFDAMTAELRRMHARMDANEEEFDRLKEETYRIKAETEEIKARVRRRLDDILTWK